MLDIMLEMPLKATEFMAWLGFDMGRPPWTSARVDVSLRTILYARVPRSRGQIMHDPKDKPNEIL